MTTLTDSNFALARYNTDGGLDSTFGSGGIVTSDFGQYGMAYSLALQPDGKLVAAGQTNDHFALARYNVDGTLDSTFGTGGKVTTDLSIQDHARALALQSDGKIVAAGYGFASGSGDVFAFARYNADGSLDATFGTAGVRFVSIGGYINNGAEGIALQPDGKMVAVGNQSDSGDDFLHVLVRLDGGTQRLYVAQDANDNVTALIGTDGQVQERFQYRPYGQGTILNADWTPAANNISAYAMNYLFQGMRYDPATGLYRTQNRDYNPALGTWMQQDSWNWASNLNVSSPDLPIQKTVSIGYRSWIADGIIDAARQVVSSSWKGDFETSLSLELLVEGYQSRFPYSADVYLGRFLKLRNSDITGEMKFVDLFGNRKQTLSARGPMYADGMNLYEYLKSNPLNGVDIWGLNWYGVYCGPGPNQGPYPPPIDALDQCCKNHDDCYGRCGAHGASGFTHPTPASRACDSALCACAHSANCKTWECSIARWIIMRLFC